MSDVLLLAADDETTVETVVNEPLRARNTAAEHRQAAAGHEQVSSEKAALSGSEAEKSRKYAEGTKAEVQGLGGQDSSKGWNAATKALYDDTVRVAAGIEEQDTMAAAAAGLVRDLLGSSSNKWGVDDLEEDPETETNVTWGGYQDPRLILKVGVSTFVRTFDLDTNPGTNPLSGLESAAMYFLADNPWDGTVTLKAEYLNATDELIVSGGNTLNANGQEADDGVYLAKSFRDQVLVLEQADRPAGATKLRLTFSAELNAQIEFGVTDSLFVDAPFAEVPASLYLSHLQPRSPEVVSKDANYSLVASDAGKMIVFTETATLTLGAGLPTNFSCLVACTKVSGEATLSATTLLAQSGGTKVPYKGFGRVTHLGGGVWITTATLTA